MHKFRASSLAEIMTDPVKIDPALMDEEITAISKKKVKTDEDRAILAPFWDRSLSAGAKTCVQKLAKEFVYGFREVVTGKYMDKGIRVEDRAIELYNEVFFTNHSKNTERKTNDWITGECDIFTPAKITDIKAAWSLSTFPATAAAARDTTYEWQGRGYMMLWDVPEFETAHCLVNTPEDLIGWEDESLHNVEHIAPELRVTVALYKRDLVLEEKIKTKVVMANVYLQQMIQQITDEHNR